MYSTELGINFFGNESNKKRQLNKIEILKKNIKNLKIFLIIAGTNTSQIPGLPERARLITIGHEFVTEGQIVDARTAVAEEARVPSR